MNIAVFCSANDLPEKYTKPATDFVKLFAKDGHNLIWGGSNTGLMREVANAVKEAGAKIIGVSIPIFTSIEHPEADEMIRTQNLSERKNIMLNKSDAVAVLVGGLGTLDELLEVAELKKHNLYQKPIVLLNTDGFYSHLDALLKHMKAEGMIYQNLEDVLHFSSTPEEAYEYIKK
jgi:uncharacterized protein (TIGR00730 family)